MVRTVDVHNHLYPKEWVKYIDTKTESPQLKRTIVNKAGHYDPEARIEDMDKYGIDTQIISISRPGVELISKDEGVEWAKK